MIGRGILTSLLLVALVRISAADPYPGTAPLTAEGDLAAQMVEGIDRYLLRRTADSVAGRSERWKQITGAGNDRRTLLTHRARLTEVLGLTEPRVPFDAPRVVAT